MNRKRGDIVLASLTALVVAAPSFAQPSDKLSAFVASAKAARTTATEGHYCSEESFTQSSAAGEPPTQRFKTVNLRLDPDHYSNALELLEYAGGKPFPSYARVKNREYSFGLRHDGLGEGNWRLKECVKAAELLPGTNAANIYAYHPESLSPFYHFYYAGIAIDELPTSQSITLGDLKPSPIDAKHLRLDVGLKRTNGPNITEASSGWADLDPNSGYSIQRSEVTTTVDYGGGKSLKVKTTGEFKSAIDSRGIVVLQSAAFTDVPLGSAGNLAKPAHRSFAFKTEYGAPLSKSDFYLSAYGLPEPPGGSVPSRTPLYVWLLVGAAAVGTLGVFFAWRRHRAAQNAI